MDTQFQPSFIPKKPVVGSISGSRSSGGVLYYIGTLVFTVTLLASGAVFGYEFYLNGNIAKMESDLSAARAALQPTLIKDLSRANNRFISAEEILNNHVVISSFFNLLQRLTLQSIRFSAFAYDIKQEGVVITMKGEARSYANVALQSKIFSEDPAFTSVLFSDLDLNPKGNVVFTVKATIDPRTISYAAMINALYGQTQINNETPATPSNATTTQTTPVSQPVSTTTPRAATTTVSTSTTRQP